MITKNYRAELSGTLVASGAGVATATANPSCQWLIGDSTSTAPVLTKRHSFEHGETVSMALETGEYLWVYGQGIVAVTADNPAAGDI